MPTWRTCCGLIAAILISMAVSSCSSIYADRCGDVTNPTSKPADATNCSGDWISPKVQRATVYEGDDSPRLWTGDDPRTEPNIDASALNSPPGVRRKTPPPAGAPMQDLTEPPVGYYEGQRVTYPPDSKAQAEDIANVGSVSGAKFDPDEVVQVNFENARLDYFLDQMLHGALGVNYIAPPNLNANVTFRSELPLPKRFILQVVRDILSRNGLAMQFMHGVYQIGTPEVIAGLGQISASGRTGERITRLVTLNKGNAAELANLIRSLLPDDVTLAVNGGDKILVHAQPTDMDGVVDLITSLSAGGFGENRIAIMQLHNASPAYVAGKLIEFYHARNGDTALEVPTILPLENQRAILIGSKDRRIVAEIKTLALRLDTASGVDDISLRVIPLINLNADETALQLNAVFNGGNAAAPVAAAVASTIHPSFGASSLGGAATSPLGGGGATTTPSSFPSTPITTPAAGEGAPSFSLGSGALGAIGSSGSTAGYLGSSGTGAFSGLGGAGGSVAVPGAAPAAGPLGIRIIPDVRNNALLVYSSYSMFVRVSEVVKTLDVPQSEVVIEATVAEVELTDVLQHGVQAFLTSAGVTARSSTDPTAVVASSAQGTLAQGAGAVVHIKTTLGPNSSADVVLSALQNVTTVKVISTPYLTVLDGKTANFVIGQQIPYATTTQNATITGTVTVTQQIQQVNTGIIMQVTPKIKANDSALLTIDQQISSAENATVAGTSNLTPIIDNQEIKSDVLVQSGHTILLGGLIKDSVNKTDGGVPVAMNLPFFGDLFKQHSDTGFRQELIVMITPRVIRHYSQVENIARMLRGLVPIR